ncbi:MAG: diacylglycerol kinase family lipid kinase [Eggerthellaceae bacterium]|nr:diacylglycerol kinase family lipid kinase [Eggerthellaceae bacterium]
MPANLGSILLIANPTSQNGRGEQAANRAYELLCARFGEEMVQMVLTEYARHAVEIAAGAEGYQTVVALGGDGLIHEVANGLMRIEESKRPALGLIPAGSGNDYGLSLGISSKVERAVEQLASSSEMLVDVGMVNDEFFLETLSFGLDAAIAADTVERRKRTGRTGTLMYFEAGLDQMLHHLDVYPYRMTIDGAQVHEGEMYLLAVQNGQTYGGHFKVCPQAFLNDGIFDICVAHPPLNALSASFIFALAKEGFHKRFKQVEFTKARSLVVEFDRPVPAQVDGEQIEGSRFEVSLIPQTLRVLAASSHSFAKSEVDGYVRIS